MNMMNIVCRKIQIVSDLKCESFKCWERHVKEDIGDYNFNDRDFNLS